MCLDEGLPPPKKNSKEEFKLLSLTFNTFQSHVHLKLLWLLQMHITITPKILSNSEACQYYLVIILIHYGNSLMSNTKSVSPKHHFGLKHRLVAQVMCACWQEAAFSSCLWWSSQYFWHYFLTQDYRCPNMISFSEWKEDWDGRWPARIPKMPDDVLWLQKMQAC